MTIFVTFLYDFHKKTYGYNFNYKPISFEYTKA